MYVFVQNVNNVRFLQLCCNLRMLSCFCIVGLIVHVFAFVGCVMWCICLVLWFTMCLLLLFRFRTSYQVTFPCSFSCSETSLSLLYICVFVVVFQMVLIGRLWDSVYSQIFLFLWMIHLHFIYVLANMQQLFPNSLSSRFSLSKMCS